MEHGHSLGETDEEQLTCFHYASVIGHLPIVQYLIKQGANIEAKNEDQWIPLLYASRKGSLSVVQYLIDKDAIESRNED